MNPNCPACSADTDACACTVTPTERAEPRTATAPASSTRWLDIVICDDLVGPAPTSAAEWDRLEAQLSPAWIVPDSSIVGFVPAIPDYVARENSTRACVWGTQYGMGPSAVRAAPPGDGGAG